MPQKAYRPQEDAAKIKTSTQTPTTTRPAALNSRKHVLNLQQLIGNQATQRYLAGQRASGDKHLVARPSSLRRRVIQMKRDITQQQTQQDFEENEGERGDQEEDSDTLQVVESNYQKSLRTGKRVVSEGIKWFGDAPDKQSRIETYGGTFQKVLDAGYKVFWFFPRKGHVTVCMVRGKKYASLESGEVAGYRHGPFYDDQSYFYANTFDVLTGKFHASVNYKNADDEAASEDDLPPSLSNSEIIWFQQQHAKDVFLDKYGTTQELSRISSISREEIGNTQTLDTIFMSDDARATMEGKSGIIDEPTEEAIALLGTPNGNSAVWLLLQHEDSGTVDIEQIKYSKDRLVIKYMR